MSEEHRQSVWPWITALLIGLPTLYVASFGPACWLGQRDVISVRRVKAIYGPIIEAMFHGPQPVQDALFPYAVRYDSLSFVCELYGFKRLDSR